MEIDGHEDGNATLIAVDTFLAPGPVRDMIENFSSVAWTFLHRLRQEVAGSGQDSRLEALLERAESYLEDVEPPDTETQDGGSELVICPRFCIDEQIVSTFSMITRFGHSREINLDELQIELLYPADAAADQFFKAMQAQLDMRTTLSPATQRDSDQAACKNDALNPHGTTAQ